MKTRDGEKVNLNSRGSDNDQTRRGDQEHTVDGILRPDSVR